MQNFQQFGNNLHVEYGLAIGITLIFAVLTYVSKKKPREGFTKRLNDNQLLSRAHEYARENAACPTRQSKKLYAVESFIKEVRRTAKRAKNCGIAELEEFATVVFDRKKQLNSLKKQNFASLNELPSYSASTRAEHVMRLILESDGYNLDKSRVFTVMDVINRQHTVTFAEIDKFRLMTEFLLLEKLSFVASRICAILNLRKQSYKIARKPKDYEYTAKFKELSKNNLFLCFCAEKRGEIRPETATPVYDDVLNGVITLTKTIFNTLSTVGGIDFTTFYAPIELISSFDVFTDATEYEKRSFLTELGKQSDDLNLDEYAYTYILAKYLYRTKPSKQRTYRLSFISKTSFYLFKTKKNMLLLARALSSAEYMSLAFGKPQNYRKSILKTVEIENTFAPYTKRNTVDFGISVASDRLTISPCLPNFANEAYVKLSHKGITHTVKIKQVSGDCDTLTVNGTLLEGIPSIKLDSEPLNIEVCISKRNDFL